MLADERVVGRIGVRRQGADGHAVTGRGDFGQLQAREIDELRRTLDVLLHQIEEVRAAGQKLCLRVRRDSATRIVRAARSDVSKRPHRAPPF